MAGNKPGAAYKKKLYGPNGKLTNYIYQSPIWRKLKFAKLAENPLCEICKQKGLTVPAETVHHITPWVGARDLSAQLDLFSSWDNLQALCSTCHKEAHLSEHGRALYDL